MRYLLRKSKNFPKIVYFKAPTMHSRCVPFSTEHRISGEWKAYKVLYVCVEIGVCNVIKI